jgi:formamidopyrimidine-DNA glycosylase
MAGRGAGRPEPTALLEKLGVHLDPELLVLALTHRSFAHEAGGIPTNERLEFLGDTVLGLVVTEALYRRHPDLSEGELAKMRAATVSQRSLASIARHLELGRFVLLGKGEMRTRGFDKDSILSDTVEALIGAAYLSHGLETTRELVHRLVDSTTWARASTGRRRSRRRSQSGASVPPSTTSSRRAPITRACSTRRSRRALSSDWARARPRSTPSRRQPRTRTRPCRSCRRESSPTPHPMPELPEVETVRDGLDRLVVDARVVGVEVFREYSVRRHLGGPEYFAARLDGNVLAAAARRGKFLWLPLQPPGERAEESPTSALVAHLGMSGQLLVRDPGEAGDWTHPHLRVRLHLDGAPSGARHLDFVDQRTFGHLAVESLVPTPDGEPGGLGSGLAAVPESVVHIGRDPLDPAFDVDAVVAAIRRRRTGIKRALLDQTVVSGVGNIYADEALWRARLHYARPTDTLRHAEARRVLDAAAGVMREALVQGGTSFDSLYVNVNGESGYFSRGLAVYGRQGQPCPRCGTPVRRDPFMNRSSYTCPRCQPRPRNARW